MPLLVGCIADDMTGACDLALVLAKHGMHTLFTVGVPEAGLEVSADAVVVALKTRTTEPETACADSAEAGRWLQRQGARQLYFKYCSTFDSTKEGNIGPVTDTLLALLEENFTIVCPAFPATGRTVVNGKLYVHGQPLAESPMRHHPLTPMTESSVVRLMDAQTAGGNTGLITVDIVAKGSAAIADAFAGARENGHRYAVVDAATDEHLQSIAAAAGEFALITGSSGVALGLPAYLRKVGLLAPKDGITPLPEIAGNTLVIAGSCSAATSGQVAKMCQRFPSVIVDPYALADGRATADSLAQDVAGKMKSNSAIVYSTVDPGAIRRIQADLGVNAAAELIEDALGAIAGSLQRSGVRKFIVAGGETSGAVARALGIERLRTGPEIAPGIPWMISGDADPICIAFKSGNFGGSGFFEQAMGMIP